MASSSKPMPKRWLVIIGIVLLLYSMIIGSTSAQQPSIMFKKLFDYQQPSPPNADKCKEEGAIQALCQRCAKSTKSNIVYPMCCTNQEEARTWCDRYVNFGIH